MENIFFYLHHALVLFVGILMSFAFCGIPLNLRNFKISFALFAVFGLFQLIILNLSNSVDAVWKIYPLIVHLPLLLILCLFYKKRFFKATASITLAYLCCQPSKWFGLLCDSVGTSPETAWLVRIATTLTVTFIILKSLAPVISQIFRRSARKVWIFSVIPIIYYIYDYIVTVYTDLWQQHFHLVSEFLSFAIAVFFLLFCVVYHKEYEQKLEEEHEKKIIRIATEQQTKELEALKKSNLQTGLLRHDLRFLLSNLALCIEQEDKEQALKLISAYTEQVEGAAIHRYCHIDIVNYVLANFKSKCAEGGIDFQVTVELQELQTDELLFSSILSNALENAINAQGELPAEKRFVRLMLKENNGKLLLSVKNPFATPPVFREGIPVTDRPGHGYGIQSICYLTEELGGKYHFAIKDDLFVLRVVL